MKHLKKFNESLNESSKEDLKTLKESIRFVSEYEDMETHEAIDVIDKLLKSSWSEIEEWRESLLTNHHNDDTGNFTIELIDRYCSPM